MEFQRVDKKAKSAWRLTRLIWLIVLIIAGAAATLISYGIDSELGLLALIVSALVVLIQLAVTIIYPVFEYIQWSYLITDDRIEIRKGIFWRSHTIIPVGRIQHVCTNEGVIQRAYKLSTVEIHTAGGMHQIVNLSRETAQEICDKLQNEVSRKLRLIEQVQMAKAAAMQQEVDNAAE